MGVPDDDRASIFCDHRRRLRHEALRPKGAAAGLSEPWYRWNFLDFRLTQETASAARNARAVCAFVNDELNRPFLEWMRRSRRRSPWKRCVSKRLSPIWRSAARFIRTRSTRRRSSCRSTRRGLRGGSTIRALALDQPGDCRSARSPRLWPFTLELDAKRRLPMADLERADLSEMFLRRETRFEPISSPE
jgi:hypothetical protein